MKWFVTLYVMAALVLPMGCGAILSEGSVGDRPVRLDGTGAAWIDETVYEPDEGGIILRERASDETSLHLLFSSVSFDPGADLRGLPMAERLSLIDAMNRGDLLRLSLRRGDRVGAGDTLLYDNEQPEVPESGPYIANVSLQLGDDPLTKDSEYPDTVGRAASGLRATLTLNQVEPRVLGELDLDVFALDGEAQQEGVAEGKVELRFDVEVLPERLAECNFDPNGAGGLVSPCDTLSLEGGG